MTDARPDEVRIVFTPSGRRGTFARGTTVLEAARRLGVDLDSVCGGRAICGRCQIAVAEGEFPKHGITSRAAHLGPDTATETRYRERRGMEPERRLGCQTRLLGDVVVDVPPESQVHRQVVRKRAEARPIEVDPVLRLHYVEVARPDMHDPRGDLERLKEALAAEWGLGRLGVDLPVLQGLQRLLRQGDWRVTCAVHDGREIIAVWPGFQDLVYGVALDIGSTTIAAHLCDLGSGAVLASAGRMNPQIR
ncbi:MAG TPA: 2Fe-2S iron-sulfur cluster-binding protein, partial [Geminicoccaceae bacterium]|nr:2Fe-2S iron-sulfur cluster-binding protein [Geminicoccaceae bacterium]